MLLLICKGKQGLAAWRQPARPTRLLAGLSHAIRKVGKWVPCTPQLARLLNAKEGPVKWLDAADGAGGPRLGRCSTYNAPWHLRI